MALNFSRAASWEEREKVFESVQLGTIDATFISSPVVSGFTDALDGFDMPYLCDNDMDLYQEIVEFRYWRGNV